MALKSHNFPKNVLSLTLDFEGFAETKRRGGREVCWFCESARPVPAPSAPAPHKLGSGQGLPRNPGLSLSATFPTGGFLGDALVSRASGRLIHACHSCAVFLLGTNLVFH